MTTAGNWRRSSFGRSCLAWTRRSPTRRAPVGARSRTQGSLDLRSREGRCDLHGRSSALQLAPGSWRVRRLCAVQACRSERWGAQPADDSVPDRSARGSAPTVERRRQVAQNSDGISGADGIVPDPAAQERFVEPETRVRTKRSSNWIAGESDERNLPAPRRPSAEEDGPHCARPRKGREPRCSLEEGPSAWSVASTSWSVTPPRWPRPRASSRRSCARSSSS
jgi:hypothetical protein